MYNSTNRYAYRVDLNIDVAITSYSTVRVLQDVYVQYCTHSSTPVRYGSTRFYGTAPVLVRARRILFEIKYGTSTVQYIRVLVQVRVQAREGPEYRTLRYGTGTVV